MIFVIFRLQIRILMENYAGKLKVEQKSNNLKLCMQDEGKVIRGIHFPSFIFLPIISKQLNPFPILILLLISDTMFENLQGKSAAETFWLKLMNSRIQKRFLKMKEKEETTCLQEPTFDAYYACVRQAKQQMEEYVLAMQFYQRKFETCIDEGVRLAHYKEKNVYNICSRKMTEHMKQVKL